MARNYFKILFFVFVLSSFAFSAKAESLEFNVNSSYDYQGRSQVTAFLNLISEKAYFYVEENYYNYLSPENKQIFSSALSSLSQEFDKVIYPKLTEIYGSEWKPGIDRDERITILFSRIKSNSGGYFYSGDEYPRSQVSNSNEREMVYFNIDYVSDPLAKSYLAHEFMHLISFNQKDLAHGVEEDVWLNEGRAEIAPSLLGYDNNYDQSSLRRRVLTFLQNQSDSLTEWRGIAADYGVLDVFMQYMLDHYGRKVFVDSLRSSKTGISSLDEALRNNGHSETFSDVFTNWTIAVLINDCSVGQKYCYLNDELKELKVLPQLNYLPAGGESTLSITNYSKDWMGSWIKLIGGGKTLKMTFSGDSKVSFKVPYILKDSRGQFSVGFFNLNSSQGTLDINDFEDYDYLVIMPLIQDKTGSFGVIENYYKFTWSASFAEGNGQEALIAQLTAQVEFLMAEVARLQAQLAAVLGGSNNCQITNDLYFGMTNNNEVRCLQQFLKSQGPEVYPEGFVTGSFYSMTLQAVIRFQEKYGESILYPVGLQKGTGFVGTRTRNKIKELMGM